MSYLFTSESVFAGHPDKVCDQVSDAILDYVLQLDPDARVACECTISPGLFHIMGEITAKTEQSIPYQEIARETLRFIGYDNDEAGFNCDTCSYIINVVNQSPDIAAGVDRDGAGDQGMMFGYATNETETYMPYPIYLARGLTSKLTQLREDNVLSYLRPDAKAQVSVNYDKEGNVVSLGTIVLSTQHDKTMSDNQEALKEDIRNYVFKEVLPQEYITDETREYINPTGIFEIGGPHGDAGLTGRKIIVDTYGGYARHGGGAFSGKDCTKVDRSACYMARYVAKNIVASGLAEKCEVQVSYAIGVAEPTSIMVDTFGTGADIGDKSFEEIVRENFDLTPLGIINTLDLRRPIYKQTAKYGHFGNPDLPWEQTKKVEDLKKYIKNQFRVK